MLKGRVSLNLLFLNMIYDLYGTLKMMTIPHKVLRNSNLFPEELTKNSAPPPPLNWLADLGPRRPKLQFYFCFGSNDHILLLYYVILLFDVPNSSTPSFTPFLFVVKLPLMIIFYRIKPNSCFDFYPFQIDICLAYILD